jgi:putative methylase
LAQARRPLSKRQLEVQLGQLRILEYPQLKLEQYPVLPEIASELLYMAGFEHCDLRGRVIDLGTGTGRLAIGAALMGAETVLGVDIDRRAIALADENARKVGVDVEWVISDLDGVRGSFDAVVMNPPYGTRTPHNDTRFLSQALELASIAYSIHKSSTREFLMRFARKKGWEVDAVRSMSMRIPHLFEFHRKKWETIRVDLYRITS